MSLAGPKVLVGVVIAAWALVASAEDAVGPYQESPQYREVALPAVAGVTLHSASGIDDRGRVLVGGLSNATGERFSALVDVRTGRVVETFQPEDFDLALSKGGDVVGAGPQGFWILQHGVRSAVPLAIATGVNHAGLVSGAVGFFFLMPALYDARTGVTTQLGTFGGGQGVAFGVNETGQATGDAVTSSGERHAFLWGRGTLLDLGTLTGSGNSVGVAVDRTGRVAGYSDVGATVHAALWDRGGIHDLGTLAGCEDSQATALDDRATVVGYACGASAPSTAFVSFRGGPILDLNEIATAPDGFVYSRATGVNDAGTIVGNAASPDGAVARPFVLVRER